MRKISLVGYDIPAIDQETGKETTRPYEIKTVLINLLFHPELKLGGRELLQTQKVATRIEECKEDYILLEETEYSKIKQAIESIKGFSKYDVELVERVLEAEFVEVEEKK